MAAQPRKNPYIFIALLLGTGLCLLNPCFAADEKAGASPGQLAEIESLEKNGLYIRSSEGSLGPDIWKGGKRSRITEELKEMPAISPEHIPQGFIHGVLLTKNDGGLVNDKPLEAGEDLFTLRLEKLLQGGMYEEANALYAQLPGDPYHETLAYQGALAYLLTGDKSSGCIEARAAAQSFAGSERFKTLIEYCNTNNIAAPVAIYDLATFRDYTLEKLATLVGDGSIDATHVGKSIINDIPPLHIPLLLKSQTLPDESRFLLNLRAMRWGLITIDELQTYYVEVAKQETLKTDGKKIAESYVMASQMEERERWPVIRKILLSENTYGTEALLPFAEMLEELKPLDINYEEVVSAARIMIRAGHKIPPQWTEIIRESVNSGQIRPYDSALLGVVYLSDSANNRVLENKENIFQIANRQKNKENFYVNYIIENIDKSKLKVNNDLRVYEKDYRLTFDHDYVMPSDNVWHRLLDTSQESNVGETVLLSTLALEDKTLPEVHPDVLIAVLKALEKVGLTDTSERLALAALIGGTFKGEN